MIKKLGRSSVLRVAVAAAAVLLTAGRGDADILSTSASVRPDNSLIVDIQVTTGGSAAQLVVTYQTAGVDPLVSRLTSVSTTGPTTITIGRETVSRRIRSRARSAPATRVDRLKNRSPQV